MPFCLYARTFVHHPRSRLESGKLTAASASLRIDLNADVGESFGAYTIGHDAGMIRSVTSVSIAAGFHGGDPTVLRQTLRLARAGGVAVGAHPGFPDLSGFGRRDLHMTEREAEDMILYQVAAVAGVAAAEGTRLQHVKPHGALYNMAARQKPLAAAIARAVASFDPALILFAPPGSALLAAGREAGLRVAAEGFGDRAYQSDGSLVPRSAPGSVIHDAASVVARTLRLLSEQVVDSVDGTPVSLVADTICLHGDTQGADDLAAKLRAGLEAAGVEVRAIGAGSTRARGAKEA